MDKRKNDSGVILLPERFIFRIDVGNMTKDRAMESLEKIREKFSKKFSKKQTYK